MPPRHPLPTRWLFTDPRIGEATLVAARALPPGSGIVVRDDALAPGARWRLLRRLVRIARVRGHMVLLAGLPAQARRWGADGVHLRRRDARVAAQARRLGLGVAMPVHSRGEALAARRGGADIAFISPLFSTRSHPGARALSRAAWLRLARLAGGQPVALGGMTAVRARQLKRRADPIRPGWAAIDAWVEKTMRI